MTRGLLIAMALVAIAPFGATAHDRTTAVRGTQQIVYLSPTGRDASCRRGEPTHPCLTLGRAYAVAHPGDAVSMGGGTYKGDQNLQYDSSKAGGPAVTFAPAAHQQVAIDGSLNFSGSSFITIAGMGRLRVHNMNAALFNGHQPSHLTISGVRAFVVNSNNGEEPLGGTNYFDSVDHLTLRNVEIGPTCCDLDGLDIAISHVGDPTPTNVVLDHVYIHDIELSCGDLPDRYKPLCHAQPTDEHIDCLQFFGGINVVIENSRFYDCSESDVMTGSGNGGTFSNWTIQNNLFGSLVNPDNGVDISDGGPKNAPWGGSIRVLHNTFEGGPNGPALIFAQGAGVFRPGTTAYVAGNAGGLSRLCLPGTVNLGITFEWNVWGPFKCGARDVRGAIALVRQTVQDPDLHLSRTSQGIGVVDEKVGPVTDADGMLRPRFWKADAGALQREASTMTLGRTIGPVSLGMPREGVEDAEGQPATARPRSGVVTATYRRFGGELIVEYANGTVVGVGTTSRYYSTSTGLAVGQPLPNGWSACTRGVRRTVNGRFAVALGLHNRITAIWSVTRPYADVVCKAPA